MSIGLRTDHAYGGPEAAEIAKKAMHPYETDKAYFVCYPCFLRSLGVKP